MHRTFIIMYSSPFQVFLHFFCSIWNFTALKKSINIDPEGYLVCILYSQQEGTVVFLCEQEIVKCSSQSTHVQFPFDDVSSKHIPKTYQLVRAHILFARCSSHQLVKHEIYKCAFMPTPVPNGLHCTRNCYFMASADRLQPL